MRRRKKGTERVLTMGWKPSSRAAATAETAAGGGGDAAPAALGAGAAAAVDAGGVVAGAGRGEGVADSGDGAGAAAAEDATAGAWWCAASLRRRREVGGTCAVSVAALLHACSSLCCGTPLLRLRLWLCGARVRGLLSAAVAACIGSGLFVSASVRVCLSLARTHAADEKEVGEATKTREKRGGTIRTEKTTARLETLKEKAVRHNGQSQRHTHTFHTTPFASTRPRHHHQTHPAFCFFLPECDRVEHESTVHIPLTAKSSNCELRKYWGW